MWKLTKFTISWNDNKKIIYPYGEDAIDYITCTNDDYVAVHHASHRHRCISDDYRNMSVQEKIKITDNSGGYVERYEIHNQTLIHYFEISMFLNHIQTTQIRNSQCLGNNLILECEYPSEEYEENVYSEFIWERTKLQKTNLI